MCGVAFDATVDGYKVILNIKPAIFFLFSQRPNISNGLTSISSKCVCEKVFTLSFVHNL